MSTSFKTKTEADTSVSKDFAETISSKAQTYDTIPETAKAMVRHKGCPFMRDSLGLAPGRAGSKLTWESHQPFMSSESMRTEYSLRATAGRSKTSRISDTTSAHTYTNTAVSDM